MRWPDPMLPAIAKLLPPGYSLWQLSRLDVQKLTRKVLEWHPNIRHGDGARFTRAEYYLNSVSLKHEIARDTVVYVGRKNDELVCMVCVERDCDTKDLYGRLGIVDPLHRRSGVGIIVMELIEHIAQALGMANVYTYATLHDSAVQHLLEKAGYTPVGVIPGRDREYIQTRNEIVRVSEVLYLKSFSRSERILTPSPKNMTTAVKKIWRSINSNDSSESEVG